MGKEGWKEVQSSFKKANDACLTGKLAWNTFSYYSGVPNIQLRAKQTAPLVNKHYENEVTLR